MSMIDPTDTKTSWLAPEDIADVRDKVPIVYVEAVPVRCDEFGQVLQVGLLLRMMPDGMVSRAVVSGRVLYGETIRQALVRHLTKDLGPVAGAHVPPSPVPFTVVEYFPDPDLTGFYDPRQHAVSLAYVVPITGECAPSQDFLEIAWVTPEEATSLAVRSEMNGGQDKLLRRALAHVGRLP
jgi:ADP-ribose pyrophosphatase YjhB (NUDIX family)